MAHSPIAPYLFVWYQGFLSAYYIFFYRKHVSGTLYRRHLDYLARGIGAVIGSSILLQFVTAERNVLQRLTLGPLLIVIYLLLMSISVGYIYIALGAKRLKKVEEV